MSGIDDILFDGKGKLPDDKLIAYLEGRLSPEERREVELWLAEEGMETDAIEGLTNVPVHETEDAVQRINHQLRKEIYGPKQRRKKQIVNNPWSWLAVLIILILAILAYTVLYMAVKK